MPIFTIHHVTRYEYDRPVKESMNEIKIFPYRCKEQEIVSHEITISHRPELFSFIDYWGNKIGVFNILAPHSLMTIESKLVVETNAPAFSASNYSAGFSQLYAEVTGRLKMLELSKPDTIHSQQAIDGIAASLYHPQKSVALTVEHCCNYIFHNFKYIKGITTVETTVDEILSQAAGVCQDFAHVMLQILRTLQVPCQYVSGYICPNKNGMRGEGATHAWVEAWIPGYGWAGIDPTNNVWVADTHVKLAVGRDFSDCTTAKGTFKGPAKQTLSVFVSIGYEDGHVFKELNNVNLHTQTNNPPEEIKPDGYAVQQQQ